MKPTENTFSFSINAVREQAEPPNEKVEKLESPESFDLFDKFVRGAREREHATGSGQRPLSHSLTMRNKRVLPWRFSTRRETIAGFRCF